MLCSGAFSVPSFRAAGGTSLGGDILRPFRTSFSRSAYITDVIFFMLCPIPTVATSALVKILPPQQSDRRGRRAGSPPRSRCRVSCWWQIQGDRPGVDIGSLFGDRCSVFFWGRCRVSFWEPMKGLLSGADVIALHEIHLARQSSLQVPVGHIPVPGGIKLCSPGTLLVANYLIINNGSCQVNFTKPNTATIRYTNSERGSARMALRHLWAGSPCQSADRCPLRHTALPQNHL